MKVEQHMKSSKDSFGDRMKLLEGLEAHRRLMPGLPVMIRLDGRGFSKFTKGMKRPFDEGMHGLMQGVTVHLMEMTGAILGYTQSDEISLVMMNRDKDKKEHDEFFGGRIQKLCSVIAAAGSVYFNSRLKDVFPEKADKLPMFDCRVWNVPSEWEAANTILWREQDCVRNSISMSAHSMLSHKSLQGLNGKEKKEKMLVERGVRWDDYPVEFKHGSFFCRRSIERPYTVQEIDKLPLGHQARHNPLLIVKRSEITKHVFPELGKIKNLPGVLFFGEDVLYKESN